MSNIVITIASDDVIGFDRSALSRAVFNVLLNMGFEEKKMKLICDEKNNEFKDLKSEIATCVEKNESVEIRTGVINKYINLNNFVTGTTGKASLSGFVNWNNIRHQSRVKDETLDDMF